VLRTSHFLTIVPLVAVTDLVCTMPARIAHSQLETQAAANAVVVLPPPVDVPGFDVAMFWHPRRERDPAVRWLRDQIRAAAAALR
jgi:DNA-binding transcriptional LysR family regulator